MEPKEPNESKMTVEKSHGKRQKARERQVSRYVTRVSDAKKRVVENKDARLMHEGKIPRKVTGRGAEITCQRRRWLKVNAR